MSIGKLIEKFCDLYDYRFYENYSGRFMYGRNCVGIVCSNTNEVMLALGMFLNEYGVSSDTTIKVRSDDFGKENILYFPDIQGGV